MKKEKLGLKVNAFITNQQWTVHTPDRFDGI